MKPFNHDPEDPNGSDPENSNHEGPETDSDPQNTDQDLYYPVSTRDPDDLTLTTLSMMTLSL